MALKPEDMDFISNFNTFWAVFLGAILATIGGFGATQAEWILERKRRERNAAIFFGELLTTMNIILTIADETRSVGDPYGPITLRMLRSAVKGSRHLQPQPRDPVRPARCRTARPHPHAGVADRDARRRRLRHDQRDRARSRAFSRSPGLTLDDRAELDERLERLNAQPRIGAFDTIVESSTQLKSVVRRARADREIFLRKPRQGGAQHLSAAIRPRGDSHGSSTGAWDFCSCARSVDAARRSSLTLTGVRLAGRQIVRHHRDLTLHQTLDVAQIGLLRRIAERDRDAIRTGARGAADAVDIAFRLVGQLEVDDMGDVVDVDAARRDVGRDQHAHMRPT